MLFSAYEMQINYVGQQRT